MIDPRIHVTLDELVKLEHQARGYSFLPRQPVHSILTGRHSSRLRGRGLDFEELRAYLPGDDIRNIDWKVTARTREPHVRVFTEERDRPAIFLIDQRISMFFGTRRYMKSVTAAHVAGLGAWRAFSQGDRVGGLVFNDERVKEVKPHRSRRRITELFKVVVDQNQLLSANAQTTPRHPMLLEVLKRAARIAPHDCLITVISDFAGWDDECRRQLMLMAQHNDVIAALVYDPIARHMPANGQLVVGQGELQVELKLGSNRVRKPLAEFSATRLQNVEQDLKRIGVPVLPVDTGEEPHLQIRHLLGQAAARRQ